MLKPLIVTLAFLISIPAWAEARQYFRYKDENGRTVINSSIPPEYVSKGYEVIDDKGVVLRVVEPQISDEEMRRRRQEQQDQQARKARDEELTKLYRSPRDVDRALETWLSRLDMEIRMKKKRIVSLRSDYNELQSAAADQTFSEQLLAEMADVQAEIDRHESEIIVIEKRKDEARKRFEADRRRMIKLYERLNGKPWAEPEASENTSE